jgi:hypothetical protein
VREFKWFIQHKVTKGVTQFLDDEFDRAMSMGDAIKADSIEEACSIIFEASKALRDCKSPVGVMVPKKYEWVETSRPELLEGDFVWYYPSGKSYPLKPPNDTATLARLVPTFQWVEVDVNA